MEHKTFSIIIPACDRPFQLEECLLSLSGQNYPKDKMEVIVVDDGELKKAGEICKKKFDGLKILYIPENHMGPAAARNTGLRAAGGEIVLFLGDDIAGEKDLVLSHNSFHCANEQLNRGALGYTTWSEKIEITPFMRWLETSGVQFDYNSLKDGAKTDFWHFYTCNVSLKRAFIMEKKIFFNEDFRFAAYEDMEYGFNLAKEGFELYYIRSASSFHLHRISPYSYAVRMFKAGRAARFLEKKIGEKMGKDCGFIKGAYKLLKASFYFAILSLAYRCLKEDKIFRGFVENFYALGYIFEGEKK